MISPDRKRNWQNERAFGLPVLSPKRALEKCGRHEQPGEEMQKEEDCLDAVHAEEVKLGRPNYLYKSQCRG